MPSRTPMLTVIRVLCEATFRGRHSTTEISPNFCLLRIAFTFTDHCIHLHRCHFHRRCSSRSGAVYSTLSRCACRRPWRTPSGMSRELSTNSSSPARYVCMACATTPQLSCRKISEKKLFPSEPCFDPPCCVFFLHQQTDSFGEIFIACSVCSFLYRDFVEQNVRSTCTCLVVRIGHLVCLRQFSCWDELAAVIVYRSTSTLHQPTLNFLFCYSVHVPALVLLVVNF